MLKTYPLRKIARDEGSEHVLGLKELGTHACYMIYGELEPGEAGREVCPGAGHEEILIAVCGNIEITGQGFKQLLPEGEAVHLKEEETYSIGNPGDSQAVYIMAGGHSGKTH